MRATQRRGAHRRARNAGWVKCVEDGGAEEGGVRTHGVGIFVFLNVYILYVRDVVQPPVFVTAVLK